MNLEEDMADSGEDAMIDPKIKKSDRDKKRKAESRALNRLNPDAVAAVKQAREVETAKFQAFANAGKAAIADGFFHDKDKGAERIMAAKNGIRTSKHEQLIADTLDAELARYEPKPPDNNESNDLGNKANDRRVLRQQKVAPTKAADQHDDSGDSDEDSYDRNAFLQASFYNEGLVPCTNCASTCKNGCYTEQCLCYQSREYCAHDTDKSVQRQCCIGRPDLHPLPPVIVRRSEAKDLGLGLFVPPNCKACRLTVIGQYSGTTETKTEMNSALEAFAKNRVGNLYHLEVGAGKKSICINGENGGLVRFINYTCDPDSRNVEFQKWSTVSGGAVDQADVVFAVATDDIFGEMWADYGWLCTTIPSSTKSGNRKKAVATKATEGKILCRCKKSAACAAGEVYLL